jgi:hypothetical protein
MTVYVLRDHIGIYGIFSTAEKSVWGLIASYAPFEIDVPTAHRLTERPHEDLE